MNHSLNLNLFTISLVSRKYLDHVLHWTKAPIPAFKVAEIELKIDINYIVKSSNSLLGTFIF